MIKKLSVRSKSIKYNQTARGTAKNRTEIVAKMLPEGRRYGEIDCEANHKRVKNGKVPRK